MKTACTEPRRCILAKRLLRNGLQTVGMKKSLRVFHEPTFIVESRRSSQGDQGLLQTAWDIGSGFKVRWRLPARLNFVGPKKYEKLMLANAANPKFALERSLRFRRLRIIRKETLFLRHQLGDRLHESGIATQI
jgi:hypothetical protein